MPLLLIGRCATDSYGLLVNVTPDAGDWRGEILTIHLSLTDGPSDALTPVLEHVAARLDVSRDRLGSVLINDVPEWQPPVQAAVDRGPLERDPCNVALPHEGVRASTSASAAGRCTKPPSTGDRSSAMQRGTAARRRARQHLRVGGWALHHHG